MASSSSFASITSQSKYDVFISFRGEDTRDNFTSHLFAALCRKNIKTFIDNELERGDEISPALLRTIEGSKISVIIFSKDYASSKWCLDELVNILELRKTVGQIVIPVFYQVDPSHVRHQIGSFAVSFAKHVETFKDKVQIWRSALTEAANLSGWDSSVTRPESILIDKIVGDILKKLNLASSSILTGLIGINSRIEQVMSLLCIGLPDFRMVGIWGMGGIGKTTIAGAVFNLISTDFEGCYFSNGVREAEKNGGLVRLRDELVSKILGENLHIGTPNIGHGFIKDRLLRKRVLIVLDDVSDTSQLETLFGGLDQFGPGSRIIITTRDKQVLDCYNIIDIYDVEKLNDDEALQLFCQKAFKENHPVESYIEFSNKVVRYAQGIPLALKVLGSSLYRKNKQHWESALNKLKKIANPSIRDVLKISYDGLDDEEKDIFLDIACFFKGDDMDDVTRTLDVCYNSVISGINALNDKSLIFFSDNNTIEMHDLLQEMGWDIVHQESEEPGKRSRLWIPEDVHHVLTNNTGTEKVKGIFLNQSRIKELSLSPKAFKKMYNLKFLRIYCESLEKCYRINLPQGLKSLPDKLRYLCWHGYPLKSLPSKFCPENLAMLDMSYSNIKQLWSGSQNLVNLKEINLSESENLIELPDLSQATNLERMFLSGCKSLVEVPLFIKHLNMLTKLDLSYCSELKSLPSNINLRSLTDLYLDGCTNITNFPEISWNIKFLHLKGTAIEEVPSWIKRISGIVELDMEGCIRLTNLPSTVQNLVCLETLNLSGCTNITKFPEISGKIVILFLNGTAIEEVPTSIGSLSALRELHMRDCKRLKSLPTSICKLKSLYRLKLSGCLKLESFPEILETMADLGTLDLSRTAIKVIPSSIQRLTGLGKLKLESCKNISQLPDNLGNLEILKSLRANGTAMQHLPSSISNLTCLEYLDVSGCEDRDPVALIVPPLSGFSYLRKLCLNCLHIRKIPEDIGCLSSLEELELSRNDFKSIPASLKQIDKLCWLDLSYCKRLKSLPELPRRLAYLNTNDCTSLETISNNQQFLFPPHFLSDRIVQHTQTEHGRYIFSNCFKLDQDPDNNIVEKAQLIIQKVVEDYTQAYKRQVIVCIPGSELSDWFNYQSRESSITIQVPLPGLGPLFLGFAFGIVVSFEDYNDCDLTIKCEYHLETEHGDCCDFSYNFRPWPELMGQPRFLGSDHMFLLYDEAVYLNTLGNHDGDILSPGGDNWSNDKVSFKFCFVDEKLKPLHCCKVKICGVRFFHQHVNTRVDLGFDDDLSDEVNPDLFMNMIHMLKERIFFGGV